MPAGSRAVVQLFKIEPQWSDQLTCRPGVGHGVGLAGWGHRPTNSGCGQRRFASPSGCSPAFRSARNSQHSATQPAQREGKPQLRHSNRKVSKIWLWVCLSGLRSHHSEPPFAGCVRFGSVKSYQRLPGSKIIQSV